MDRFTITDNKTKKHNGRIYTLTSMEKDLSTIKWCSSINKIRKILDKIILYGLTYKNINRRSYSNKLIQSITFPFIIKK